MREEFRRLLRRNLEEKLKKMPAPNSVDPPSGGWIKAVRLALGMPARYPATKLQLTAQGWERLERSEAHAAITLKNLKKAADALDCDLIYALVPRRGSLDNVLRHQAEKRARAMAAPVAHSMRLESQGTNTEPGIADLARQLEAVPKAALWVDE